MWLSICENFSHCMERRSRKTEQRHRTSRLCFVQIIERVIQWHTPDAAEPGLLAELSNLGFVKTERAEPCAIVRQRRGHAVEHAYPVKHRAERISVLLELIRTV